MQAYIYCLYPVFLPHVAWYRHSKIVHIIFLFVQFLLLRCPSSCTGRGGRWGTTRWWGGSRRDRSSRPPALYSQVSYKHLYLLVPLNRSSRLYTSKRQLFNVHAATAKIYCQEFQAVSKSQEFQAVSKSQEIQATCKNQTPTYWTLNNTNTRKSHILLLYSIGQFEEPGVFV